MAQVYYWLWHRGPILVQPPAPIISSRVGGEGGAVSPALQWRARGRGVASGAVPDVPKRSRVGAARHPGGAPDPEAPRDWAPAWAPGGGSGRCALSRRPASDESGEGKCPARQCKGGELCGSRDSISIHYLWLSPYFISSPSVGPLE